MEIAIGFHSMKTSITHLLSMLCSCLIMILSKEIHCWNLWFIIRETLHYYHSFFVSCHRFFKKLIISIFSWATGKSIIYFSFSPIMLMYICACICYACICLFRFNICCPRKHNSYLFKSDIGENIMANIGRSACNTSGQIWRYIQTNRCKVRIFQSSICVETYTAFRLYFCYLIVIKKYY